MSAEANVGKAARELAQDLDCIGTTMFNALARAFEDFADRLDPPVEDARPLDDRPLDDRL